MRILIATDAWFPQVNGVVTTIRNTVCELERLGHTVGLVTHEGFRTVPCPSYPEIRLAIAPGFRAGRMVDDFAPDAIHIATEAPLGLAVRRHCLAEGLAFTTAFHTQFPEPHRHIRAGDHRGNGVRHAGGRVSRHRPGRRDTRCRGRGAGAGSARGSARCTRPRPRGSAPLRAAIFLGSGDTAVRHESAPGRDQRILIAPGINPAPRLSTPTTGCPTRISRGCSAHAVAPSSRKSSCTRTLNQ